MNNLLSSKSNLNVGDFIITPVSRPTITNQWFLIIHVNPILCQKQ